MTATYKDRLASIAQRKSVIDAAAHQELEAARLRSEDDAARRLLAAKLWKEKGRPSLERALSTANVDLQGSGISLRIEDNPEDPKPAIARFLIHATVDSREVDRTLRFSVNAYGKIQTFYGLMRAKGLEVDTFGDEQAGALLADFIDAALADKAKRLTSIPS